MPVLDVEIVAQPLEGHTSGLAGRIARLAGAIFDQAPGRTWVKVRRLPYDQYGEDGDGPPAGVYPVFVHVLKAEPPRGEALRQEVAELTAAIAEACGRPPENVHIMYAAPGAGRVAFGGRLVGEQTAEEAAS